MKFDQVPLILASASPRRRQLLEEAGYKFKVEIPNIDEPSFETENSLPAEHAKKLALAKAMNVADSHLDSLIIAADTLVDLNGQIIGKPKDAHDARLMLTKLSGSVHKVITALAIVRLSDNIEIIRSESTTIYPKKMTNKQIDELIKSGLWKNKSGACSIEDSGQFVEKIEGSITNVMGLPMELLEKLLIKINEKSV
ncbi:MAG: Maf family protein [Planctomycetota bacterium]|jgi:septum formation protein